MPVCLSVRLSVAIRYCIVKTAKRLVEILSPQLNAVRAYILRSDWVVLSGAFGASCVDTSCDNYNTDSE